MNGRLYDAAGNRILWLDAGGCGLEDGYDQLKATGFELSQRCQFEQEMTAVLFRSARCLHALFWNPDGTQEMMCGNAIRCLTHFISEASTPVDHVHIQTPLGKYQSRKLGANHGSVIMPGHTIRVAAQKMEGDHFVDAGTPHRIRLVNHEWPEEGLRDAITCSKSANPVNFNLVRRISPFQYRVRTFERGVGETSSCGTAAVSIVAALQEFAADSKHLQTPHLVQFASGEQLTVRHGRLLDWYEIGGRVALLREVSIPEIENAASL